MKKIIGLLVGGIIGAAIGLALYGIISSFFSGVWSAGPAAVVASPIYLTAGACAIVGVLNNDEPFHMIIGTIVTGIAFGIIYLVLGAIILFLGGLFSSEFGAITVFVILLALIIGVGDVVVIIFVD